MIVPVKMPAMLPDVLVCVVARYHNYLQRAFLIMKELLPLQHHLSAEQLDTARRAKSVSQLHAVLGRDFHVTIKCQSLHRDHQSLEGTRLSVIDVTHVVSLPAVMHSIASSTPLDDSEVAALLEISALTVGVQTSRDPKDLRALAEHLAVLTGTSLQYQCCARTAITPGRWQQVVCGPGPACRLSSMLELIVALLVHVPCSVRPRDVGLS